MQTFKVTSLFALVIAAAAVAGCGGSLNATIGGTVSGLAGSTSLVLMNNGTDALTVNTNGNFTFATSIESGNSYNVTVQTQPTGETCSVTYGSGVVPSNGGNITNVQVNCVAGSSTTSAVSASVSGLASGATVTLLNNGVDPLSITGTSVTALGGTVTKIFPTPLTTGANYNVTVGTQPSGQICSVTNGVGQIPTTGSAAPAIVTCQ